MGFEFDSKMIYFAHVLLIKCGVIGEICIFHVLSGLIRVLHLFIYFCSGWIGEFWQHVGRSIISRI